MALPYLCVSSYGISRIVVTQVVKSALSFQRGREQVLTCWGWMTAKDGGR